jgi:transcriptional regulator with XRE-family HTH domain
MHRVMDPLEQDFYKAFGAFIKTARQAKKLSMADLGNALGVTHATISSIEKGRIRPVLHQYVVLCRELNLPPSAGLEIHILDEYRPRRRRSRIRERAIGLTKQFV